MRKAMISLLVLALLLCGCQAGGGQENNSSYYNDVSKAQEIAVVPADSSEALQTLTDKEEITDFVSALDMDNWDLQELPKEAEILGSFRFSQEKTVKYGETATDGELEYLCELLCYKDVPYITFRLSGFAMTFEVSADAAAYLAEYFE